MTNPMELVERLRAQANLDHEESSDCCLLHMAANEIVHLEFLLVESLLELRTSL